MEKILETDSSDGCEPVCVHSLTNDLKVIFCAHFTEVKNNREKKKAAGWRQMLQHGHTSRTRRWQQAHSKVHINIRDSTHLEGKSSAVETEGRHTRWLPRTRLQAGMGLFLE